jgi:hypothetical protein
MPEPWALIVATVILGAGGIAIWTAALMPQFFPVWSGREDPLAVVGRHAALWRLNAVLLAFSAVAMVGCALTFPVTTWPCRVCCYWPLPLLSGWRTTPRG